MNLFIECQSYVEFPHIKDDTLTLLSNSLCQTKFHYLKLEAIFRNKLIKGLKFYHKPY